MMLAGLGSVTVVLGHGPGHGGTGGVTDPNPLVSAMPITNVVPFLSALPIPSNAVATAVSPEGYLIYEMRMRTNLHAFHPDISAVPIWGYSDSPDRLGGSPGPTIQATNGIPIIVRWINELPDQYPNWIPADTRNHGVENQDVRNVVHLHGGANRPLFDGNPLFWIRPGVTTNYFYDNIDLSEGEDGETLWYHDHAVGVTANNVYAGLAGMYLLRNPEFETSLGLPAGSYEIPLVFQDRDIQDSLEPATLLSDAISTNVAPWHYLPVVNGAVAPYLEVEPRRYRFRILNGSGFRTIGLALVTQVTNALPSDTNLISVPLYQIGTDDGFLDGPVTIGLNLTNALVPTLRLMPGARADVMIDFTEWAGYTNIVVTNSFDSGNFAVPPSEPRNVLGGVFLQFRVAAERSSPDTSRLPEVIHTGRTTAEEMAQRAVRVRQVTLDLSFEEPSPGGVFDHDSHLLAALNMRHFDDPVTENPRAGDVEIWEFLNLTPAAHPMHVHLLDFLVLNRTRFRGSPGGTDGVTDYINDRRNGKLKELSAYLDPATSGTNALAPAPNELGPKDVVHTPPRTVTRIVMRWPTNEIFFGPYVYHCHILDHEDNDMMRPIEVRPPLAPGVLFTEFDALRGTFSIEVGTRVGVSYDVLGSEDLVTWQSITRQAGTGMTLYVTDPAAYVKGQPTPDGVPPNSDTGAPYRFYRAEMGP